MNKYRREKRTKKKRKRELSHNERITHTVPVEFLPYDKKKKKKNS